MVHVGPGACGLPLDDVDLHVFDLDPYEEEVDLANNHVFQMVPGSGGPQKQGRNLSGEVGGVSRSPLKHALLKST